MKLKRLLLVVAIVLVAFIPWSCGGSSNSSPTAPNMTPPPPNMTAPPAPTPTATHY